MTSRKAPHPVPPGMQHISKCPAMDPKVQPTGQLGGFRPKAEVKEAVDSYENYHTAFGGSVEERRTMYADMVNKYYDLVTSFYEYGWGQSFHFAHRLKGEPLKDAIRRHEYYVALKLGLGSTSKVLDVGCGIGGPLRNLAQFSGASITGLNNNAFQVKRGREVCQLAGLDARCAFVTADFMNIPAEAGTYDCVYQIEATVHAPDIRAVYAEIFRVLKPGGLFAGYEWCVTDRFDPENAAHARCKAEIELGNGLPHMYSCKEALQALQAAGFEVEEEEDRALSSEVPWFEPLAPAGLSSYFTLQGFRCSPVGKVCTSGLVWTLESCGLAPKGSYRVSKFLERAADGLVEAGLEGIFTPMYFYKARKPLR